MYVAGENASAARAIALRVDEAPETLGILPEAGRQLQGRRVFPVPRTSLVLIYRLRPTGVQVTRCFDGRENWQAKIS